MTEVVEGVVTAVRLDVSTGCYRVILDDGGEFGLPPGRPELVEKAVREVQGLWSRRVRFPVDAEGVIRGRPKCVRASTVEAPVEATAVTDAEPPAEDDCLPWERDTAKPAEVERLPREAPDKSEDLPWERIATATERTAVAVEKLADEVVGNPVREAEQYTAADAEEGRIEND